MSAMWLTGTPEPRHCDTAEGVTLSFSAIQADRPGFASIHVCKSMNAV